MGEEIEVLRLRDSEVEEIDDRVCSLSNFELDGGVCFLKFGKSA